MTFAHDLDSEQDGSDDSYQGGRSGTMPFPSPVKRLTLFQACLYTHAQIAETAERITTEFWDVIEEWNRIDSFPNGSKRAV